MSRVTEFLLFRHGETDWNKEKRLQGHTDIPLNEAGREQARALQQLLQRHSPQIILTSDLSRARETADIANEPLSIPVIESRELREGQIGDAEGLVWSKIVEKYGEEAWRRWTSIHADDLSFSFPNGETKANHLRRFKIYLESVARAQPVEIKRIGVSSHGGSVRRLVHSCEGAPSEPVSIPNCVLYLLTFAHDSGEWRFEGRLE